MDDQGCLALTGDISGDTTITIYASESIKSVTWNGKELSTTSGASGTLVAKVTDIAKYSLPELGAWESMDSLPEIKNNYKADSAAWISK